MGGATVGGAAVGGAFLYKAETLWGQGATVIHLYGNPLQKPLCLSHPHRPLGSPEGHLVQKASSAPLSTAPSRPRVRTGLDGN